MSENETTPKQTAPGAVSGGAQMRRLALEAGPLLVFFVANWLQGIMVGTAAFMVATVVAVSLSWRLERRVPPMPLVGCVFVLFFGGLTLWLEDETFIKIKPTVVNLLFAAILTLGAVTGRHYLKLVMGTMLTLADRGWQILTWRWIGFFIFLAALNEIVWRSVSTDLWVDFKVFVILPLTLVFGMLQMPLILRYQPAEE